MTTNPPENNVPTANNLDHQELRRFAARHALVVNELQEHFANWLGDYPQWNYDATTGTLTLGSKQLNAQLLGTHAYDDDTWMWIWANPGFQSEAMAPVTDAACWLRDQCAQREQFWQLREPIFPLEVEPSEDSMTGWPLFYAAIVLTKARASYSANVGGARVFLTCYDEQVPLVQPDPVTFPRLLIGSVAGSGAGVSAQLESYAAWHKLNLAKEGSIFTLNFPNGSVLNITVDEHDRATNITGQVKANSPD